MSDHTNVHLALGAAQIEMGKLVKGSTNSAFKKPDGKPSTYADLADVVEAVRAPFANNGLAFFHTIQHLPELGMCMVTTLVHGSSGTFIDCPIPLILDKNSMHGFKSATTYAKRIGLESLSGIAPEDDDGNAASNAAPKPQASVAKITDEQRGIIAEMLDESGSDISAFCKFYKVDALVDLPADAYAHAFGMLSKKIEANKAKEAAE